MHLKAAGHGLIGDSVYGWKPDPRHPLPADRVMLHSEHLVFTHPVTGKTLDLRAPLPADFQAVLEVLRKENPGRPGHPFSSSSAATPQRRL